MSIGTVIAFLVIAAFALWRVESARKKRKERDDKRSRRNKKEGL
jgi:hypothetical protein